MRALSGLAITSGVALRSVVGLLHPAVALTDAAVGS